MEQLTDPGELYARAYHACAVSNDMFVSWGGSDSNLHAVSGNVTLFYNLKKNVWQTSYSPVPEEGDSETPFGRLSSLSLAVIIGVTAGSIGIVLVAGYVFYRRRQRQRQPLTSSAGILGEGSSSGISTTKHPFWPLEALQNGESEPGIPMVAVGLLHEQRQPQQLLQSHGIKRTRHPSINSLMKRQSLTLGRI